jgi:hypothetical protein
MLHYSHEFVVDPDGKVYRVGRDAVEELKGKPRS